MPGNIQQSRYWPHYLGLLLINLLLASSLISCGSQNDTNVTSTPASHISTLQTGTGFDPKKNQIVGESSKFKIGETIYVVFTVKTTDNTAQVVLKLRHGDTLEDTSLPVTVHVGTQSFEKSISLNARGKYTIEVDYNDVNETSIDFTVS